MSLRSKVLDFIQRVYASPVRGSDPGELAALEKAVFDSWEGSYAAEVAPVSPFTWEQRTILLGNQLQSARVPFRFPFGIEITGFHAVVTPLLPNVVGGGAPPAGSVDPISVTGDSRDVIDVSIDVNNSDFVTNANGIATPGNPQVGGTFVTLSSQDIQGPRLQGLRLTGESPDLGFTFRWKLGLGPAGTGQFFDSMVAIAMFVRPLPMRNISQNTPDLQPWMLRR